jgi:hypothetical protein
MLLIVVPLIVLPMLMLAVVGFIAASGEAAKTSTRYLKQRDNDLRTLSENPAIGDYYFNQLYGLTDEAEVYRCALECALQRFANRSNSGELLYIQVRYVDARGDEVVKLGYAQALADTSVSRRVAVALPTVKSGPGSRTVPPSSLLPLAGGKTRDVLGQTSAQEKAPPAGSPGQPSTAR